MTERLGLEAEVITALRRISRAISLHSRTLLHDYGLTVPQLAALHTVQKMQPVTVGALAKAIHVSQATLTGILRRLESRGLVSRTRTGEDRRNVVVHLTEEGGQLIFAAPSVLQERFRRELGKLQQWEQTMILATLQRVASMMDAGELDAAAGLDPSEVEVAESELPYVDPAATELPPNPEQTTG